MTNLLHQRFAKPIEAEFGSIVSGHAWMRIRARQRRDVDDIASTAPTHFRNCFVAAIEHAEEICFQHGAKIFRQSFFDIGKNANPSVVNQNIETAKLLDRVGDQGLHLVVVAHVANKTYGRPAQFLNRAVDLALLSGGDTNREAFAN